VTRFFQVWLLSFILKLVLATILPLSPDEAYYWIWSHHLQLSYFDHPPFVAWLFYFGHWFESWGQLIRAPTVFVGHLTMLVWYLILKDRFSWEKYKFWFALALVSPLIGFGSLLGTPDVGHVFFWSLALFFFRRALSGRKLSDYILFGLSLGLGFCAKYHIVLFIPIALVYLIFEKRWREVSIKGVLLTVVSGFVASLPVLIWNYQNDFVSFKYQLNHGLGSTEWLPEWTFGYLLAEILLLCPWIFFVALKARPEREFRFLRYFAWGPLLFFSFSSFRGAVELNWPIAAFPAVFALALFTPNPKKIFGRATAFFLIFYGVAFSSAIFLPEHNAFAKPFREPLRFRKLASLPKRYSPLYAGTYQIAATLWWENKSPTYKLRDMSRYDFFDTLPASLPQNQETFFLVQENWSTIPEWVAKAGYKTSVVQEIEPHYLVVKVFK
jgi:4-amino-4-deoxy-L-arabinose transferase-like glycosyltransferase